MNGAPTNRTTRKKAIDAIEVQYVGGDITPEVVLNASDLWISGHPGHEEKYKKIRPHLVTVSTRMKKKYAEFLASFEAAANEILAKVVDESETEAKSELYRYGLNVTEGFWGPNVSMQEGFSGSAQLSQAADMLVKRREHIDEMARMRDEELSQTDYMMDAGQHPEMPEGGTEDLPPSYAHYAQVQADWEYKIKDEEAAYAKLVEGVERQYPIMSSFIATDKFGLPLMDNLKTLAAGSSPEMAELIGRAIGERARSIRTIREAMKDPQWVWTLPKIVQMTRAGYGIPDDSTAKGALVSFRVHDAEPSPLEGIVEGLLLVVINVVAVALSPATGGLSLAADFAINAAVVNRNLKEFALKEALTQNTFDQAKAISQDHPEMLWVALDIVSLGFAAGATIEGLRAAKTTLESLAPLVRDARYAEEGERAEQAMARLRQEAESVPNGGAALADKLVADVNAMRAGSATNAVLEEAGATKSEIEAIAEAGKAGEKVAAEEGATSVGQIGAGQLKVSKGGTLLVGDVPLKQRFAKQLAQPGAHAEEMAARVEALEAKAAKAKLDGDEKTLATLEGEAAALEKELRTMPAGWESPLAKSNKDRFEELLKKRGTYEKVPKGTPNLTAAEEAEFLGLEPAAKGYRWKFVKDQNTLELFEQAKPLAKKPVALKLDQQQVTDIESILEARKDKVKAVESAQKALEADPSNEALKDAVNIAKNEVKKQSWKLGEAGAEAAVQSRFPGAKKLYGGGASRSGDFDFVFTWKDPAGKDWLIVAEAKGGGSQLGSRMVGEVRAEQLSPSYFDAIAENMSKRGLTGEGGVDVGAELQKAKLMGGGVMVVKVEVPVEAFDQGVKSGVKVNVTDYDVGAGTQ